MLGNRCFGVVLRVSVFDTDHMKSFVDNKGAQHTHVHTHTQCGNRTTFGKVAKRVLHNEVQNTSQGAHES